jgi:hypothetical protein
MNNKYTCKLKSRSKTNYEVEIETKKMLEEITLKIIDLESEIHHLIVKKTYYLKKLDLVIKK